MPDQVASEACADDSLIPSGVRGRPGRRVRYAEFLQDNRLVRGSHGRCVVSDPLGTPRHGVGLTPALLQGRVGNHNMTQEHGRTGYICQGTTQFDILERIKRFLTWNVPKSIELIFKFAAKSIPADPLLKAQIPRAGR